MAKQDCSEVVLHPSVEIAASREQNVAQASQPDPSVSCHSQALGDPNLMDMCTETNTVWFKLGPSLGLLRLLGQRAEGVQVESEPQLKLREAKANCSIDSPLLDVKLFLLPASGTYKVAWNFPFSVALDLREFCEGIRLLSTAHAGLLFSSCMSVLDLLPKEGWERIAPNKGVSRIILRIFLCSRLRFSEYHCLSRVPWKNSPRGRALLSLESGVCRKVMREGRGFECL